MFVCCRILWITIVLISTCAFFYQCQHLGRHYLSWPVRMKITMSRQEKIGFPAITICNQNAFRYCLSQFSSKTNYLYASLKREHIFAKNYTDVITCYHMLTDTQHTSIRTPTCTRTRQRTHTRTHAQARTQTHTHTHTHTHNIWRHFLQTSYSSRERFLPLVGRHVQRTKHLYLQLYKVGRRKPIDARCLPTTCTPQGRYDCVVSLFI